MDTAEPRVFASRWRGPLLVVLLVTIGCLAGCPNTGPTPPPKPTANTSAPRWIHQANPPSATSVVFVHGIFGDTVGTWTDDASGKTFFDFLQSAPGMAGKFDIYAFGFTSNMFKDGSLDIREASNKLEDFLTYNKVWDYRTVVFVAHSMGGLIVLKEMINYPKHREQTPLVMLYATPSEGSQITSIAKYVVNNPAISEMLNADGNVFLQELSDSWGLIADEDKPTVICAYEKSPVYGQMIVPWSSATRFCKGVPSAIEGATHITIVKPDRQDHPSVVALVNAMNQYVVGTSTTSLIETPDFVPEGDHWTYSLTDVFGQNPARLKNVGSRALRCTVTGISNPKLMVVPDETAIPANHTDELKLALLRGELAKDFSFVLQLPPLPDRKIEVKLPDIQAIQQQQSAIVSAATSGINDYLSSSQVVDRLNHGVPKEAQLSLVASAASNSIAQQLPGLPESARAVVTADALAAAGWPQLAHAALANVKLAPDSSAAKSAQAVGGVIAAQSGAPNEFSRPDETTELLKTNTARPIAESDAAALSKLASRMQSVSALKAEGLSLQGDVALSRGDGATAHEAFKQVSVIRKTPLNDQKLVLATRLAH